MVLLDFTGSDWCLVHEVRQRSFVTGIRDYAKQPGAGAVDFPNKKPQSDA